MAHSDKPTLRQRHSSTLHYQTFPTPPPTSRGKPPASSNPSSNSNSSGHERQGSQSSNRHESPLPKRQLAILAVIALAEQTALNSISPYLPDMASTFPEVSEGQVGLYVGLIASTFALAQFLTNFFWGWLSDRIGRKPVVLCGTLLTAACFVAFGFCRRLWQAILVQVLMGLVNGNQGVISTCLGEITDRSNQSKAFTYLPVIYGLGGITGPLMGGLLVFRQLPWNKNEPNPYPYLAPNLLAAVVLIIDLVLTMLFLEESLEAAQDLPPLGKRVGSLFTWIWQFSSSSRPSYIRRSKKTQEEHDRRALNRSQNLIGSDDEEDDDDDDDDEEDSESFHLLPTMGDHEALSSKAVFNRDTILLLITFLVFQLSNISFNSLYPIFAQGNAPTGRNLSPEEIGLSLGFAGVVTIVFQIGVFGKFREKVGNKIAYRVGFAGFVVAYLFMPFIGYKDGKNGIGESTGSGKIWLWVELGGVLIIKTIAAVGCLTSALLLVSTAIKRIVVSSLTLYFRLQTLPPTTLYSEHSMDSPRHFLRVVEPLVHSSRAPSLQHPPISSQKAKHSPLESLEESHLSASCSASALEARVSRPRIGMKKKAPRTKMMMRMRRLLTRKPQVRMSDIDESGRSAVNSCY